MPYMARAIPVVFFLFAMKHVSEFCLDPCYCVVSLLQGRVDAVAQLAGNLLSSSQEAGLAQPCGNSTKGRVESSTVGRAWPGCEPEPLACASALEES